MEMIGKQIRTLRKKKGITQEQLAELLHLSPQAVSKWETGIALPDISLVPMLAGIFGVSTDVLFAFDYKEIEKDVEKGKITLPPTQTLEIGISQNQDWIEIPLQTRVQKKETER